MLKVKGSVLPKESHLEIDDYVPFKLRCQDHPFFVPLYWRTGDIKFSLIEIGMNPDNGNLASITVPCFGDYMETSVAWEMPSEPITQGVPVFETDEWPQSDEFRDNFRDEPYPLKTIVGKDFVAFWILGETEIQQFYIHGNVCIGVDKERAVRKIEFVHLSTEEIQTITRKR